MQSGKRVLVFGGTGFLGRSLSIGLAAVGWKVHATCREATAARLDPAITWHNVSESIDQPFTAAPFDAVVNCAVEYGRGSSEESNLALINSWLPSRLLELTVASGSSRLIHCDSFYYKRRTGQFFDSSYTHSKALGTLLLNRSKMSKRIPVAVARLEHVYGNSDAGHKMIPTLVNALGKNVSEFRMTEGSQRRDFIWVDDAAAALVVLASTDLDVGVREFEVGLGRSISLRSFAEKLKAEFRADTVLEFGAVARPPTDIEDSYADLGTWGEIPWRPVVDVDEGVKRLAAGHSEIGYNRDRVSIKGDASEQ